MADSPVQQRGAGVAAAHIERMAKRARDPRDASYKVRSIFRKAEASRFASSGAGTWKGLAESTRERKSRVGQDPRVLRASGALYKSLTAARARDQVDERKTDAFRFGTTVPYAIYHDTGRGVPRRQLIDLTGAERREIEAAISKFVATGEADRW